MQGIVQGPIDADACSLRFAPGLSLDAAARAVDAVRAMKATDIWPDVDPAAVDGLKFSACLPASLAEDVIRSRCADAPAIAAALGEEVHTVVGG